MEIKSRNEDNDWLKSSSFLSREKSGEVPSRPAFGPARHCFGLQKLFDAPHASFAGSSGLFDSTKGGTRSKAVTIDFDHTCLESASDTLASGVIGTLHVMCESVHRIIRQLDGFVFVIEGKYAQDRTEDFFSFDGHARFDIGENRRFDEKPPFNALRMPKATGHKAGAFVDSYSNIALDLFPLLPIDQWA